ncbi:MAG: alginate lyase family protein [Saprospiraceae bacterium]|nr:alginate lyase family protein [Saprospiraceae bacterium]
MKKKLPIILSLTILITLMCKPTSDVDDQYTETILMDAQHLETTRARIEKNDPQLRYAFDQLIEEAEMALKEGPFSVTHKEKLPASGDKHDYASYSRYWWPDPNQPDGLPYIRRDGETNPDSQSPKESDRQRIGALGINTETLGLAYYFTGEEKYANKAAELLRVWFLDEVTRMNPNVNHAQCRPGHNTGTKSGVLDGRLLVRALEGSLLISGSSALSEAELERLQTWAGEYFNWLTTNEMALEEAASKNNHGSYYDVQAMYFALYSGNHEAATEIAQNFPQRRIFSQIKLDGSMPEEMARTRPLFYSIYNLHAMFLVTHLAMKVDVDVWNAGEEGSRLRAGLDYLVPYTDPNKAWPHPTIRDVDRMELFAILHMADRAYPDGNYLKEAEKLPLEKRQTHRANLVSPLMR